MPGIAAGLWGGLALATLIAVPAVAQDQALVARGRYIIKLGGCNDCHTQGFNESGATLSEREWLKGNALGFHGPWGTTYAVNLRLFINKLTEAEWLKLAGTLQTKPPMPWWAVRWMTSDDQRAVYAFIRYLGPAGTEAPADLPPGITPPQPALMFPMPPPKQ